MLFLVSGGYSNVLLLLLGMDSTAVMISRLLMVFLALFGGVAPLFDCWLLLRADVLAIGLLLVR